MRTFSYEAGRVYFHPYSAGTNLKALEGKVNYFLTEEQQMIKDLAAQIAKEKIAPLALEYDEAGKFPWDVVEVLANALALGFADVEFDGRRWRVVQHGRCYPALAPGALRAQAGPSPA